jgi:hypothetical protein
VRPGRLLSLFLSAATTVVMRDAVVSIPFSQCFFAPPALDRAIIDELKVDKLYAIDKIRKDQTKSHFMI